MATIMSIAKKTIISISKSHIIAPCYALSTPSFSTAYERAEASNAVAEAEGSSDDGMRKVDGARDGPIKSVDDADMVKGTAKETMDGAWKASQEASHKEKEKEKANTIEDY